MMKRANIGLNAEARVDHVLMAGMVASDVRVLDIGCGDGALLELLATTKNVDARGIELSQKGVNDCVSRGLSVIQGDADRDLFDYPDKAFDYVILSQTLQATYRPRAVLEQMLRIGDEVIVSIPNFGHWLNRLQFVFGGRMPVTEALPYSWYNTPNIHFCTIKDFTQLCEEVDAKIEEVIALNGHGQKLSVDIPHWMLNLIGEQAIFRLRRKS